MAWNYSPQLEQRSSGASTRGVATRARGTRARGTCARGTCARGTRGVATRACGTCACGTCARGSRSPLAPTEANPRGASPRGANPRGANPRGASPRGASSESRAPATRAQPHWGKPRTKAKNLNLQTHQPTPCSTMTQIPDNCPAPDELLKKLQSVAVNLPKCKFDKTCKGELSMLIARIASQSDNLTSEHLMHAVMGLLKNLQLAIITRMEITLNDKSSSDIEPHLHSMLILSYINKSLENAEKAADIFIRHFKIEFGAQVSESFLESINVSREEYEEFRNSHGTGR